MALRGQGRRRHSKEPTSGKNPGKKTTKSSFPSLTLNEILNTLSLTYDNQLGILSGEYTNAVPPVTTLEQLRKSLVKLNDQLEIVSEHDALSILEIERRLEEDDDDDEEEEEDDAEEEDEAVIDVDDEEEDDDLAAVREKKIIEETPEVEVESMAKDDEGDVVMVDDVSKEDQKDDEEHGNDVKIVEKVKREAEKDDDDLEEERDDFQDATDKLDENKLISPKRRKLSIAQIENDPSIKNPKSEFVTSQTLPAAAQALGLFQEDGLKDYGDEFLKKKYGVASYPKNDLKSQLPGVIPDVDFSKSKPSNQVQFTTFQSYIENFYRNFTEEDLKLLKSKYVIPESLLNDSTYDPNLTPYLIPNLGPLYSNIWNEEENSNSYSPPPTIISKDSIIPKNSSDDLNDEVLETEKVSCGPLVSRLLSAIMKEDNTSSTNGATNETNNDVEEVEDDRKTSTTALPEQQGWKVSSVHADYTSLEERLKRELKYIGIFMNLSNNNNGNMSGNNGNGNGNGNNDKNDNDEDDQEPDWLNPQDDEVSAELRKLQTELKTVSTKNNKFKKVLLPIVENQLAWQEYLSILDDLDKQVDQAYLKKIRVPKNKKKSKSGQLNAANNHLLNSQSAQQIAANQAIKSLLEKRNRWITKIGALFDKDNGETMKRYPKESLFLNLNNDQTEFDYDENYFDQDGEELGLSEQ